MNTDTILLTLGAGGILTFIYKVIDSSSRRANNVHRETINLLLAEVAELKKDKRRLEQSLNETTIKLFDREKALITSELAVGEYPFAYWIKDVTGTMRFINKEYERLFNVQSEDYIDYDDEKIWGAEKAKKFRENDVKLLHSVSDFLVSWDEIEDHVVIKWKIKSGLKVIAIAGICIPLAVTDAKS